jgi:hypothetical protein
LKAYDQNCILTGSGKIIFDEFKCWFLS